MDAALDEEEDGREEEKEEVDSCRGVVSSHAVLDTLLVALVLYAMVAEIF